jgi:hypothetical protein
MRPVFLRVALGILAITIATQVAGQAPASPRKSAAIAKTAPASRGAPFGPRDLDGIWTNVTLTPLQRPPELTGKATLTEAEAADYERKTRVSVDSDRRAANAQADLSLAYNDVFFDRGTRLARVQGTIRTSLIVDPPDGKIPPLTAEAQKRNAARPRNSFDSVKDRPLGERCLLGFNSTDAPMLPVFYNNNFQIVQSPTTIMILVEMIHDVRFIHMDRSQHLPTTFRQWLGDSIGHWEGNTLVIDTTNFTDQTRFAGSGENLHVIERLTRVAPDTILYRFTIDDPTTFTRQWSAEYPFLAARGPIYEYACHEGNYAIAGVLAGARAKEKAEEMPKQEGK